MDLKIKTEIKNFLEKQRVIKYKKGQILVRPEDDLGKIVLEKEGFSRVYKMTSDGKEVSWPNLRPLWIYSISSALLEKENEYYAEAVSDLEAYVVPIKDFMAFLEEKTVYTEVYKELVEELLILSEQLEKLMFSEAYGKVAVLIEDFAKRFGKRDGNKIVMESNIPHRVLASISGLTRETVTLQVLKLQKEKILKAKSRNIVINDIKKLEEIAQI
jgi:CRP/FNR family transcriptional regulator, cyclic AMP receptor protein